MNVLIIDDSSTARRTLSQALQSRVAHIETAASAAQAMLTIGGTRWDWIITDAHMSDTSDDQIKWLRDLRDATDAEIIVNSVNDSQDVIQLCRDRSMHRVWKGSHDKIMSIMGLNTQPDPQIAAMLAESERRVARERDARIEEIFRAMGLWDEMTNRPNYAWVRERKRTYDKTQMRMERLGIGLASAVVIAGAMLAFQLLWAGISQKVGKP